MNVRSQTSQAFVTCSCPFCDCSCKFVDRPQNVGSANSCQAQVIEDNLWAWWHRRQSEETGCGRRNCYFTHLFRLVEYLGAYTRCDLFLPFRVHWLRNEVALITALGRQSFGEGLKSWFLLLLVSPDWGLFLQIGVVASCSKTVIFVRFSTTIVKWWVPQFLFHPTPPQQTKWGGDQRNEGRVKRPTRRSGFWIRSTTCSIFFSAGPTECARTTSLLLHGRGLARAHVVSQDVATLHKNLTQMAHLKSRQKTSTCDQTCRWWFRRVSFFEREWGDSEHGQTDCAKMVTFGWLRWLKTRFCFSLQSGP